MIKHLRINIGHKTVSVVENPNLVPSYVSTRKLSSRYYLVDSDNITREDLVKSANLPGAVDYAIPQSYARLHGTNYVWYYPREGADRIMGKPVSIDSLWLEFEKMILGKIADNDYRTIGA